ncbi:hypothetical protein E3Q24_00308 [Wallemia mellicola]|nr:hypothetical protein E3Q24_00308 [Wallemia mellicola]
MGDVHDRNSRFQSVNSRYHQLRAEREVERLQAIKDGLIPDPSQGGMNLQDAITLKGTCQSMCPEFEREERDYQLNLDKYECYQGTRQVDPNRAVKTFHRPAAGDEPSLPSDVRPPEVLRSTLDYLFHNILEEDKGLHDSHHFVRDRTRSIRQDFTLQHIRNEIAIECHERIARYHILCLHELCDESGWSDQQELEQLSKVLLSLTEFYDDYRATNNKILPNEAEFRAYHLLIHLRDASTAAAAERLPLDLYLSQPIQLALKFHALARRSNEAHLRGRPHNTESSPNAYSRFFKMVRSPKTPFLMACLLETNFSQVRRGAFKAMRKAYPSKYRPFPVQDLMKVLGCDDAEQVAKEAENLNLEVERENGSAIAVKVHKQSQINDSNPVISHTKSQSIVALKKGNLSARDIIDTPLAIGNKSIEVKSSLRPTAPAFTMPKTAIATAPTTTEASPTKLMPPPPKPTTSAFSFTGTQQTEKPKANAFTFGTMGAGSGANAFTSSAFETTPSAKPKSAFSALPAPKPTPINIPFQTTKPAEEDLKEKLKAQMEAKKQTEIAKAKELEQIELSRQRKRRESELRRLDEHKRREERERIKREHELMKQNISQSLTESAIQQAVSSIVRSYVLDEVANAFRKQHLTRSSVKKWKDSALNSHVKRKIEQERLDNFRTVVSEMSFGRSAHKEFTLPYEEEEEEELFDHEDEEIIDHKKPVTDAELERLLQETQRVQQRSLLWEKGAALSALADALQQKEDLKHHTEVDIGLYTYDDTTSSSGWLRTKFALNGINYKDVDSQISIFANADQPSPSLGLILFECSPDLARNLSDDERSRVLNNERARLDDIITKLPITSTFNPSILLLSWGKSDQIKQSLKLNKCLEIDPQSFENQIKDFVSQLNINVKQFNMVSEKQISQIFTRAAISNLVQASKLYRSVERQWRLYVSLLNISIAIVNEVVDVSCEAIHMLSVSSMLGTSMAAIKQLPMLKASGVDEWDAQTAILNWLDDERFDFESDVLLLRAEIAGADPAEIPDVVYVMTRILDIIFNGSAHNITIPQTVDIEEDSLINKTDFIQRTRRHTLEYERLIDSVKQGQRKRDEEFRRSQSPPPSPAKRQVVNSSSLRDLIGSVRKSLFA